MDRIIAPTNIHDHSQKMPYASVFRSEESEERWRKQMTQNYSSKQDISPCVLLVPQSLKDTKPEAYAPQIVGLGPYHHFRPEVEQMERKKFAAVKSYLEGKEFKDHYQYCPENFGHKIRSFYDKYLDLHNETLEWVVLVDGMFLLYFMSTYLRGSEEEKQNICSNIEALVPDIMMLENQIPIILMEEILEALHKSYDVAADIHDFCEKQSPLKFTTDEEIKKGAFDRNNNMLHYMYELIVKNQSKTDGNDSLGGKDAGSSQGQTGCTSRVGDLAKEIGVQAGEIFELAMEEFNTKLADAKLAGLKVPGNVEKVLTLLQKLQKTLHLDHMKGSLGDQIDIPSASRLKAILKLKFKPLPDNYGIEDIKLEKNTLHLPVITLNSNSEVILRNLIAYESTSEMRSTKLRNYMDLMCGLIKSKTDVDLLREKEIIIIEGQLPDAEIVRMCNGIKKSDEKPDENSQVHKTVTEVKKEFDKKGVVKACRSTTKCFAALVKCINKLFPVLVLLLLALQSFCEIYGCRRSSYGGAALRNSYLGELESDPKAKLMLPRKLYRY